MSALGGGEELGVEDLTADGGEDLAVGDDASAGR